jgi:chorismate mutase
MRGIRGAITVEKNTKEAIGRATRELLQAMMRANNLTVEDIISVMFTLTNDLNAEYPAAAAREMAGWNYVPMLCTAEADVPGSLGRCIRVLMLADIKAGQRDIQHIYLGDAVKLRPDLKE